MGEQATLRSPRTDEITLRPLDRSDPEQVDSWARCVSTVFLAPAPDDAEIALRARRTRDHRVTVALDDSDVVASFRSFDTTLSLPGGGQAPVNAVTGVVVMPTHRRRNLLRRWMTDELARAHRAGSVASVLIASEAPIYGRYGYGVATSGTTWTIDARRARFATERTGSVRVVDGATWAAHAPPVHDRAASRRAGAIGRTDAYYDLVAQLLDGQPDVDRRRTFALHRDDAGTVDGALVYAIADDWDDWVSNARLSVVDLVAVDDRVESELLRYACEIDLVAAVKVTRPPGHPLPWLLADARAARTGAVGDQLWARLHDVEAALSARRYAGPGRLVLDVEDPAAQAAGRYALEVDEDGVGRCARLRGAGAAEPVDLALGVNDLAGLWLGGGETTPSILSGVTAGRVRVRDEATAARAHALFSWPTPPWAATHF